MNEYFERARPTYIENWPAALCRLSIAQVDVPLTLDEAEALGTNIMEWYETFPEPHFRDISAVRRRVEEAVAKFPNGAFVRLGSRSPKDAWGVPLRATLGRDPLYPMLACSERISDDLHLALSEGYAPHIFVRQWLDIDQWQEFRCFMKGRRLAGISQYYYRENHPVIDRFRTSIRWAIERFFEEFRSACHLPDVVFDVVVTVRDRYTRRQTEVKLIEINPSFEMTDPCLFDWRKPEMFDGRILTVAK